MKAYQLRRYGKPHTLKVRDVPEPAVSEGEVKVKVKYIGINYAEILSRKGQYSWAPKLPYIPGMEAMGEVIEVGSGVSSVEVGDSVIIGNKTGAYAEQMVVPEHLVFQCPEGYTDGESASLLVNFITAWVALVRLGRIQPSDVVLIHAAAGGVGTAAVQIAKAHGATVVGTASKEEKLKLIKELGADLAINYATEAFDERIRQEYGGADLVLEVVGGSVFKKSVRLLKPFGRLIVTGFASISLTRWNPLTWIKTLWDAPKVNIMRMAKGSYGIMATHVGYLTDDEVVTREGWEEMTQFISKHNIRPVVGKVFEFDQLSEAHAFVESRQSVGKVIVRV